ncbi:MAG: hypothetical protein JW955_00425 [Sedimentisphaerales bacterium]|nr:hypothetical protein [Sedimentisphaerales bacterium]
MERLARKRTGFGDVGRSISGHTVRELLFFTLFYLYVWLVIEPHLIFHGSDRITNFPSFYTTWRFFASHLSWPGGLIEYLSAFLSQLFFLSWLGAIVITMQAWTFRLLVAYLLRTMDLTRLQIVAYVPALLLLVTYGQYTYFFPTTVAVLCGLALASVYVHLAAKRAPAVAAATFIGLSLACYYAAGAAVLPFALVCVIPELLSSGRRRLAVLYVLVAGGLPYVFGVKILGVSIIDAYTDLLPISWKLLYFAVRRRGVEIVYVLYLLVPGIMALGGITSTLWAANRGTGLVKQDRRPVFRWLARTLALVAIGGAVAYGSFDKAQKTHFAVDYYAYHKMWSEVLIEGRTGSDDPSVMHAVNRALYHTGQLGNRMFVWPQNPTYLFLEGAEYQWAYWQRFGVHLEIGFVNSAENALMECLAGMGDRPMILQQLATINMVKGNLDTARVYLHVLSTTLFHGNWARHYLDLLVRDPDLATDRDIQNLRAIAMDEDYPSLHLSDESMLSCLLKKNGGNRMAFEYLMASHLLNRQLTRFVKRVEELHDMGYETLPRHYEEAILVYSAAARTTVQLSGYAPRDEVRQQIERFLGILRSYGGNKQAAFADLAESYGDTYAFYNAYGPREMTR